MASKRMVSAQACARVKGVLLPCWRVVTARYSRRTCRPHPQRLVGVGEALERRPRRIVPLARSAAGIDEDIGVDEQE
jgi:hypothetical protein